jgi:hypothetical protein
MHNRISFVPEIKKDFPVINQQGIEYKAIQNVLVKKCIVSATFKNIMMNQDNYLEGKECKKSILIHKSLDFTEIVENAKRQIPETLKWM